MEPSLVKFVLVSVARTGSNYIVGMLNKHPQVLCHYEIANPSYVIGPMAHQDILTGGLRQNDPDEFLNVAFSAPKKEKAVGFKIFGGDVEHIVNRVMKDSSVRKIILSRKNRLASFSSMKIAEKTGQWGVRPGEDILKTKVHFCKEEFFDYLTKLEDFYENLRVDLNARNQEFLEVFYENLKGERQNQDIFNFLGVDMPCDFVFDSKKQNGHNIIERFENQNDAIDCLRQLGKLDWNYEGIESDDTVAK